MTPFQEACRRALGLGSEPESPPVPEPEPPPPGAPRTAEEVNAWIAEQEEKHFDILEPPRQGRVLYRRY